ncbi:ParA family protein [Pseudomonas sp. C27(2019)]|nr:ParA family protein [Pseudomonas sp. C27(2019)]
MRIWAVANQKGGVGKTTTTLALAGLLADAGKRVLVVDLDPHGSMTSYFGYDPDSMEHSCYDLFQHSGRIPAHLPQQLLRDTSHEHIKLLPSSTALAVLERQSPGKDGLGLVIARTLALLSDDFDFVVIDSPPLLGVLMVNALAASEHLLIPVQTEFLALKGLERMVNTLKMINHSRQQPLPFTIVPTLFDRRTQASITALRMLKKQYPDKLWQAYIPIDTRLRDASRAGLVPSRFDKSSRAILAYRALLRHVLSQCLQSRQAEPAASLGTSEQDALAQVIDTKIKPMHE